MNRALAMVLLDHPAELRPGGVVASWQLLWRRAEPLRPSVSEPRDVFSATIGRVDAAAIVIDAPIPQGELDGPARTSWLWPDAFAEVSRATSHAIVTVSGDVGVVDLMQILTKLVAAIVDDTQALGVYWGAAGMVIKRGPFVELARTYESGLPVMLWVDFRCVTDGGAAQLFTVGMSQFGLMEIEVPSTTRSVGELREFGWRMAGHLIEHGPVFRDGDTVGASASERILVRHAPSIAGRSASVYQFSGF